MSPRLTSAQLQAAKQRKQEERAAAAERHAEEQQRLAEERAAAAKKQAEEKERLAQQKAERNVFLAQARDRYTQLDSVAEALYEEMSKLSVKWPQLPVSQRALDRTNKLIRAVRELLEPEGDDFVTDIEEFVPAGDLPEHRDVVMLLKELRAALKRFQTKYARAWSEA